MELHGRAGWRSTGRVVARGGDWTRHIARHPRTRTSRRPHPPSGPRVGNTCPPPDAHRLPVTFALLVLAGVGAGLIGSIAGLASLVSYPALLAAGLSPVTANVSNTVALVFSSIGSVSASRPELRGQRPRAVRLGVIALAGGVTGGVLLLATPSDAFALVVPWMI